VKTLVLTQQEVRSVLTMEAAVAAVERAFAAHGRGETVMPIKVYLSLPGYAGDFRAMPACFEGSSGVKWVNAHPENPARHGLPAVMAMYILSDPSNGVPLAVMDGTFLTAVRTGAAAAVATKHLGPRAPKTIGFIGCGVQARMLLAAHRVVCGAFEAVGADLSAEAAARFAKEAGGRAGTLAEAAGCDVLCTMTPSRGPVVAREWVRPGAHVNAMGADAPGKQELDPRILLEAKVVLDDIEQASESGEVNVPLHDGRYRRGLIHGTLGEVVAGLKKGRVGNEMTVFDSTGLAVQDVAVARVIYDEARRRGLGRDVEFIG
jgi:ornithine cyclodeaminase/alanine dehydrogenase